MYELEHCYIKLYLSHNSLSQARVVEGLELESEVMGDLIKFIFILPDLAN